MALDPDAFLGSFQDDIEAVVAEPFVDTAVADFAAAVKPHGLELNIAKSPVYYQPGGGATAQQGSSGPRTDALKVTRVAANGL
eukprot:6772358-Alexandrium_andersonii.AAC.1